MTSLQGMSVDQDLRSPAAPEEPFNPWSPDAFEEIRRGTTPAEKQSRPFTSIGIGNSNYDDAEEYDSQASSPERYGDGPPQLNNYVQRMESRLRQMHAQNDSRTPDELHFSERDRGPMPPPKNPRYQTYHQPRPQSSMADMHGKAERNLKNRKSAYELGRQMIGRTFTTKSSATSSSSGQQSTFTNESSSTQKTGSSVMSGQSAGGFSATSAASLARRSRFGSIKGRPGSAFGLREKKSRSDIAAASRPQTPSNGVSYHSSHNSSRQDVESQAGFGTSSIAESAGIFGGFATPKPKKSGFFKKMIESAKTGAASARSSVIITQGISNSSPSPTKPKSTGNITGFAGGTAARDMGLGGSGGGRGEMDWVQVRRDVNRSNSLSKIERAERAERCQMLDHPVIAPVEELLDGVEGDEGSDGRPVTCPTDFQSSANLAMVDKSARFVNNMTAITTPASLAQGHLCRPYRSEVQRLRAIFTWVAERISWDEDFEGEIDTRRVIQTKRGCAEEVAVLVMEMCSAVGLHAEIVRGHLKAPSEALEFEAVSRPNHWWNAVIVDGEWRMMDCSLASPTNPRRSLYSCAGNQVADGWYFLTRPSEICYTHIPSHPEQQHICPPIDPAVLAALPCACAPYFRNDLQMIDYDTSLVRVENLELVQIQFSVPADVECTAEVEAKTFHRDMDGDFFESGEVATKRALAQADWYNGQKRYTIKACLPGDEGQGVLKVYAGKRGLMHSIKNNPHPLAFALPINHEGENPPYDFLLRHPTPHAQRHDLYVAQPQCARLVLNNTFVFAVRQHPSSLSQTTPDPPSHTGRNSPLPFTRPSSAMSMISSSAATNISDDSAPSVSVNGVRSYKPAKLAIQAPSGKILRLMRKSEHTISTSGPGGGEAGDGGIWETIIKVGERGVWRGLILADRSARWCVWGEWECV